MKLIYTSQNQVLVGHVKNLVESAGISVLVKNEFLSSGFGELSGADAWPELWVVEDVDYPKAIEIVEAMLNRGDTQEWTCSSCSESNDASFEYCWSCQSEQVTPS